MRGGYHCCRREGWWGGRRTTGLDVKHAAHSAVQEALAETDDASPRKKQPVDRKEGHAAQATRKKKKDMLAVTACACYDTGRHV